MNESTKKLVDALGAKNDPRLKKLIRRAKREEFHDFDSPHALPETILLQELIAYGLPDLAERLVKGDFDATPEESERWANSPEGLMAFDDAKAVADTKELAKMVCKRLGQEWDEEAWNNHISKNQLG